MGRRAVLGAARRASAFGIPKRDRGAAVVEFALVVPILIFVIFGLVDFGRAFNTQIQLSQAAREGARLVAMSSTSSLSTRVQQAAPGLTVTTSVAILNASGSVIAGATTCAASGAVNVRLTVTTPFTWVTGISAMSHMFGSTTFPTPTQMQAVGVMQCVG